MRVILASKSPRRKELLSQIGLDFEIIVSECEEKTDKTEPADIVKDLSLIKAQAVKEKTADLSGDYMIIGSDTIVYCNGEIMGKPKNREDAVRMLEMLEDNTHFVYSGVTVLYCKNGLEGIINFAEETKVSFYPMTAAEIEDYVDSKEPMDKAGGYAIQGICAKYIKGIEGDYASVVGLPLSRLYFELKKANMEV